MHPSRRFTGGFKGFSHWVDQAVGRALGAKPNRPQALPRIKRAAAPPPGSPLTLEPLEDRALLSVTILTEGFEGDFPADNGWIVADVNASGTPAYWEAVDSAFGGEGVHGGIAKGYCAGVGYLGTSTSPRYPIHMRSTMSITLDLRDYFDATLEFWYKSIVSTSSPGNAYVIIDSSSVWYNDGQSALDWTKISVSMEAYTGSVRTLSFDFISRSNREYEGMYLDDIVIVGSMDDPDLDDSLGQAIDLGSIPSIGEVVQAGRSIDNGSDVDMYAFEASTGQKLCFDIDSVDGGSMDSYIRLFDSSGTEIAYKNNAVGPSPEHAETESYLEYTFIESGVYYLGVSGVGNKNYNAVTGRSDTSNSLPGGYDLIVSQRADSDGTISDAVDLGMLPAGGSIQRMDMDIDRSSDVDIVAVTVIDGQTVGFDIDRTEGSTLLSHVRLFDSSGTILATNNDQVGPAPESFTSDSYIEYTFSNAGTYYLGISSEANTVYNPVAGTGINTGSSAGGYDLIITDRHDPDDTIVESFHLGTIPFGGSIVHSGRSIDYKDVDFVSFYAETGRIIDLDIDVPLHSDLDGFIRLYDSSGVSLASSSSSDGPLPEPKDNDPFIEYVIPSSGIYYLAIFASGNFYHDPFTGLGDSVTSTYGEYDLIIYDRVDPDGTFDHALHLGAIPVGGSFLHSGQTLDFRDIDMVAFTVSAGQTLGFDIDNAPGSDVDARVILYDTNGNYLTTNEGGGGPQPEFSPVEPYLDYTFPADGTYYLATTTRWLEGGYELLIFDLPPDPDDTYSEAVDLGVLPVGGSISRTGQSIDFKDVDIVAFTVSIGQSLGFDIDVAAGGQLLSYLRLFNAAGVELATDKDTNGPLPEPAGYEAFIEYSFTIAGTYYLGVSAVRNESYNPITGDDDETLASTGGYDLIITDRNDPDDAISEAFALGVIPVGGAASRLAQSINYKDVDLVAFTVVAGQTLAIDIDRTAGSGLDSYLRLLTAAGTQLAFNDDDAGPSPEPSSDDSFLEHTFASAGTYYLVISARENIGYNPTTGTGDVIGSEGGYDLFITDRPPDTDDTLGEAFNAGTLAPGGVISRSGQSIGDSKDVDMVAFSVFAGQIVQFDVDTAAGGPLNSYIRLFDAAGAQLAANNNGVGPVPEPFAGDSYLQYTFTLAGTYCLGVSASGNTGYNPTTGAGDLASATSGGYDLIISDMDPDIDDAISQAFNLGAVPIGGPVSRLDQAIDVATDVDMVAFSVVAGQILGFDIDRTAGSSLNSYIKLFDASGAVVASNDDGVGPLPESSSQESYFLHTFTAAGTFYLGISGASNTQYNPLTGTGDISGSTGGYSLTIGDPDPDDAINQSFNLGSIPPGGSVSRLDQSIDQPVDVDLHTFSVTAGQTFIFDIDTAAGGSLDSYIRIFHSTGIQLTFNNNGAGPAPEFASGDSFLEYTFAAGGTYYLGISSIGNTAYTISNGTGDTAGSTTGAYNLTIANITDTDDTIAVLEAVQLGSIASGAAVSRLNQTIGYKDVDMLAFSVAAGQVLGFDIDAAPGSLLDSHLRLFNSSGTQIASNTDGVGPFPEPYASDSYFEHTFSAAGTYYLGVSAAGNTAYNATSGVGDVAASTGGYDLHITNLIDPDDAIAEAAGPFIVPAGGQISRTGQSAGFKDVDMVAITVAAGRTLRFDIDTAIGGPIDSFIRLFDGAGTQLAFNDDAAGPAPETSASESYLQFTFAAAGTYYLGVSAAGNDAYSPTAGTGDSPAPTAGGYDLIITDVITTTAGDFNSDDLVNAADIDLLQAQIRAAAFDPRFDLNSDAQLTQSDVDALVRTILDTEFGDTDLNGAVSLGDLVILATHYETPGGWADGDFSGNGIVSLGDLVILAEHYGAGDPPPLTADESDAQPEPLAGLQALGLTDGSTAPDQDPAADEHAPLADILAELGREFRA